MNNIAAAQATFQTADERRKGIATSCIAAGSITLALPDVGILVGLALVLSVAIACCRRRTARGGSSGGRITSTVQRRNGAGVRIHSARRRTVRGGGDGAIACCSTRSSGTGSSTFLLAVVFLRCR